MKLFSHTNILEKSMEAAWLKDQVISHNINNIDTPGYKKMQVNFGEELKSALDEAGFKGRQTRQKHVPIGRLSINELKPEVSQVHSKKMRVDQNSVDIDAEMAEQAWNTIHYYSMVQKLNGEIRRMKSIIQEGRR